MPLPAVLRKSINFLASALTWFTCCAVMGIPPSFRVAMNTVRMRSRYEYFKTSEAAQYAAWPM